MQMIHLDQPYMGNHLNANSRKTVFRHDVGLKHLPVSGFESSRATGDLFDGMYVYKFSTSTKIQTKLCEKVGFSFRKC